MGICSCATFKHQTPWKRTRPPRPRASSCVLALGALEHLEELHVHKLVKLVLGAELIAHGLRNDRKTTTQYGLQNRFYTRVRVMVLKKSDSPRFL